MSHLARIEVPGVFHLVEQRVRHELPPLSRIHERVLYIILLRHCLREYGVQLCGHNVLPRRVLLALIPERPGTIGRALWDASRLFVGWSNLRYRRYTPLWGGTYRCCPFADEVAWAVMRYVDLALVLAGGDSPAARRTWSSAAEHAGECGSFLTAPRDRLPAAEHWRAWLESPQDGEFVLALEQCLRTGKPFGPFPFVRKVEQACGRHLRSAGLKSDLLAWRTPLSAESTGGSTPPR